MNKKTLIIFAGILLFLLLLLMQMKRLENRKEKPAFEKLQINEIEIEKAETEVIRLKKANEEWYIGKWPVDSDIVDRAIEGIRKIRLEDIISTRSEKYTDFEVTSASAVVVNLTSSGNDRVKLYIGKRSSEWTKSFLRLGGDPAVYIVDSVNKGMFKADEKYWKEKEIIGYEKNEIKEVNIEYNDNSFTVNKGTDTWTDMVRELKYLKAVEFVEDFDKYKNKFDNPHMRIDLKLADEISSSYLIIKDENKYFMKPVDLELVYEVKEDRVNRIVKIIEEKIKSAR